jgi:hypothetical protein
MGPFWSELKRRNVVRVGIAYCAAGWLVIQVATALFPLFGAPTWIVKVVTTLVILGFPLALVIAWAFELTPEGLKRTDEVSPDTAPRRKGRHLDVVIIGVLVFAVAMFALDRFVWNTSSRSTPVAEPAVREKPPAAPVARSSIAVLPFVNLSNDPEQEYFLRWHRGGVDERIGTLQRPESGGADVSVLVQRQGRRPSRDWHRTPRGDGARGQRAQVGQPLADPRAAERCGNGLPVVVGELRP